MVIDRRTLDKLLEIVGGNQDDLVEIISSFLEEGPTLVDVLQKSAISGDLATVRRSAHSLKSNARDMGAIELATTCARIESLATEGVLAPRAEVERVTVEMNHAAGELRRLYNLGGSA